MAAACWLSSELSAGCGCEQGQVGFSGVSLLGCCRPQPQLGPGSVSYPGLGSGQPPGASGLASVPRQGCACPALGTLRSLHCRRQLGVVHQSPVLPAAAIKTTSPLRLLGSTLVAVPARRRAGWPCPWAPAPLFTMGPGKDGDSHACSVSWALLSLQPSVSSHTQPFAVWRSG